MALAIGLQRTEVRDMGNLLCACDTAKRCIWRPSNLPLAHTRLNIRRRRIMSSGNRAEAVGLAKIERGILGVANSRRVREHGLEYRFKFPPRRTDNLKHFRCCGLLLQRFC